MDATTRSRLDVVASRWVKAVITISHRFAIYRTSPDGASELSIVARAAGLEAGAIKDTCRSTERTTTLSILICSQLVEEDRTASDIKDNRDAVRKTSTNASLVGSRSLDETTAVPPMVTSSVENPSLVNVTSEGMALAPAATTTLTPRIATSPSGRVRVATVVAPDPVGLVVEPGAANEAGTSRIQASAGVVNAWPNYVKRSTHFSERNELWVAHLSLRNPVHNYCCRSFASRANGTCVPFF